MPPWQIPGSNNFYVVDLGPIRLDATTGTHRWQGMIEALGGAGGESISVDKVWFVPTDDGYGVLRAPVSAAQGLANVSRLGPQRDRGCAGGEADARTERGSRRVGGAGDATDYNVQATDHVVERTATADSGSTEAAGRYALAGTTTFTNVLVHAKWRFSAYTSGGPTAGLVARYTSTTSNALLHITPEQASNRTNVRLIGPLGGGVADGMPLDVHPVAVSGRRLRRLSADRCVRPVLRLDRHGVSGGGAVRGRVIGDERGVCDRRKLRVRSRRLLRSEHDR